MNHGKYHHNIHLYVEQSSTEGFGGFTIFKFENKKTERIPEKYNVEK